MPSMSPEPPIVTIADSICDRRRSRHLFRFSVASNASTHRSSWYAGAPASSLSNSLPGKALVSFGEAALRGAENLVIRRRLHNITSQLTASRSSSSEDMAHVYEDLLELARPGLYDNKITKRAIDLVLAQVRSGEGHRLIQSFSRWPPHEIVLFMTEFMAAPFLGLTFSGSASVADTLLGQWSSPKLPFFIFTCHLAQLDKQVFHQLVNVGFLDMILAVCIGTRDPRGPHSFCIPAHEALCVADTTLATCSAAFPGARQTILEHPLCALWPSHIPFFMRNPPEDEDDEEPEEEPNVERRWAWRRLDAQSVQRRLWSIEVDCYFLESDPDRPVSMGELQDMYMDLLEFARSDLYYRDVSDKAFALLERFVNKVEASRPAYQACRDTLGEDSLVDILPAIIM